MLVTCDYASGGAFGRSSRCGAALDVQALVELAKWSSGCNVEAVFAADMIVLPANVSKSHWFLGVARTKERRLDILDSTPGPAEPIPESFEEKPGATDGNFSAPDVASHMVWWLQWMDGQRHTGGTPAEKWTVNFCKYAPKQQDATIVASSP